MPDDMHLRKIDLADGIFVINPGIYIGIRINYVSKQVIGQTPVSGHSRHRGDQLNWQAYGTKRIFYPERRIFNNCYSYCTNSHDWNGPRLIIAQLEKVKMNIKPF